MRFRYDKNTEEIVVSDATRIEYDLTIFQLRLSIGRVHACAISSCKLVFLKLKETLF